MKLVDLHESKKPTIFAWLEPAAGPSGVQGVQLVYLQPADAEFDRLISFAQQEADRGDATMAKRVETLTKDKKDKKQKNHRFNTPSLGWWKNSDDFYAGREGSGGKHKGAIMAKYPNMQFVDNKQAAVKKAETAGII